jgi:hypothetical membrane protein
MARNKSGSSSNASFTLIGGILAVAFISYAVISILGSVLLYTSSPLRLYPFDLTVLTTWIYYLYSPVTFYSVNFSGATVWYYWFNFGYSWTTQWISDLGVGPSNPVFNNGLIITGIACLPFFPILLKPLGNTRPAKIGVVIGIIAGLSLIGIGVFPESYAFNHTLFSLLFWTLIAVTAGVLSYSMRSTSVFPRITQWIGYSELVGGLVFTFLSIFIGPIPEWITLLFLVIWVYAAGITMLIRYRMA